MAVVSEPAAFAFEACTWDLDLSESMSQTERNVAS
jgi:hypothetical protein